MDARATNAFVGPAFNCFHWMHIGSQNKGLDHIASFDIGRLQNRNPNQWRVINRGKPAIKNKAVWFCHD
jgi:hypothetical protein